MALTFVSGDPLGRKVRAAEGGFVDGPAANAIAGNNPASPDKKGLQFPLDLQNEQFYPEAIRFSIYKRYGKGLDDLGKSVKTSIKNNIKTVTANELVSAFDQNIERAQKELAKEQDIDQQRALQSVIDENKEGRSKANKNLLDVIVDAVDVATDAVSRNLKAKDKEIQSRLDGGSISLQNHIDLQMPESVIFNEQVDWTGTDLGVVGALINKDVTGGAIAGAIGSAGKILGGGIASLAGFLPGISGPAAAIVGSVLGGETGLAGAIESSFSVKANPYKEQTFQGVPFRPFEFQFVFRARNAEEAKAAGDIINAFRAYSKPSFSSGTSVFAYPHEFHIQFLKLENNDYITNENLPQIKYCVCKTVNTNYTGQGWKSFQGGAPVDINLTLSFEETEIITQEDVEGRTSVGDFQKKGYKF